MNDPQTNALIRENMNTIDNTEITRRPPTELINPTALARQRRDRRQTQHPYARENIRQPVVPIMDGGLV